MSVLMPILSERVLEDLKTAMRRKDAMALNVLRGLKSAFKYAAIEKGGADAELTEAEALAVLRKQIKQRQDSIESFEAGGRNELADRERQEIAVLENYLPAALDEEQVRALVEATIQEQGATSRKDMGAVMKALQEKTGGAVDNKLLSQEVMKRLA